MTYQQFLNAFTYICLAADCVLAIWLCSVLALRAMGFRV
jgi:hypothetical protein